MHEGGGRWVGSNKLVELKKKKSIASSVLLIKVVPKTGVNNLYEAHKSFDSLGFPSQAD